MENEDSANITELDSSDISQHSSDIMEGSIITEGISLDNTVTEKREIETGIHCLYTNADSLLGKRDILKLRIEVYDPDIIAITEVLPKNYQFPVDINSDFNIEGYSIFTNDNPLRGVAIYVRNDITATRNDKLTEHEHNEQVWVDIRNKDGELLTLGAIYHSPSSTQANRSLLRNMINQAAITSNKLIVIGDFNMPHIDWETHNARSESDMGFIETLQDNFLVQLVDQPTRFREGNLPSTLDLIITNTEELIDKIEYCDPIGKSDHVCLLFKIFTSFKNEQPIQMRYRWNKGDFVKFNQSLSEINWEPILDNKDATEGWRELQTLLRSIEKDCIPENRTLPARFRKPPWLNKRASKLVKKKKSAWTEYRRTGTARSHQRYCEARNRVKTMTRNLRRNFEKMLAKEAKTNPKAIWSYIRNQVKTREGLGDLEKEDGSLTQDNLEKANTLNNFFVSVFTEEDCSQFPEFEAKKFNTKLERIDITRPELLQILSKTNPSKAPGPDQLHPMVLKECASNICTPLQKIFQISLDQELVPPEWKIANVSPIYKKGNKKSPSNYRPVSLTSVACKTLEKIIRDRVMLHMDKNDLLTDKQFGFRNKRSTMLQLLHVLDVWTEMLDNKQAIDVFYLDFSKAFDRVPHERLLRKLYAYGIQGNVLGWIRNFLKDRSQRVQIQGSFSEWKPVTSGIPQGSVLGPVLFILFINDLPDVIKSLCSLFADDTKVFGPANTEEERVILQNDLNRLMQWSEEWQLKFNIEKCKVMHLGRNNSKGKYQLRMENQTKPLDITEEEKDLGVIITPDLKFSQHVARIAKKANSMIGLVRRSFRFMDSKMFVLLYKAMIRSHLEYCHAVWNPINKTDADLLEKTQRRATKIVPELRDLPYQERLKILKLPTLNYRRKRGDMIMCYKLLYGLVDSPGNLLKLAGPSQMALRGNSKKLEKSRKNTSLRQHNFTQRVVNDWNSLPEKVVTASSINTFKNALDLHWKHKFFTLPATNNDFKQSTN